uniref:hypothetical protein n=1 Tax=Hylemonella sp. TaxID=2066020 RepID=UPI00263977AE|nr:hypothetical protein [Hylemonella sp.]
MLRAVLFLLLLPLAAFARSPVAPDVDSVVSGGYWESGNDSGHYRVIVVNSGFEHVTSRVYVEWLRGPGSPDAKPSVVASVEPTLPFGEGVASVGVRLVPAGKSKVRILVSGVVSAKPTQTVKAILVATKPGRVQQ